MRSLGVGRFARGEAYGVEDGAQVAPVAVHRALDGGFQFFDFVPALRLASREWGDVFAPGRGVGIFPGGVGGVRWKRNGLGIGRVRCSLSLLRSLMILYFVPTACAVGCILTPLRGWLCRSFWGRFFRGMRLAVRVVARLAPGRRFRLLRRPRGQECPRYMGLRPRGRGRPRHTG
jgi:hypothetical protein